MPILLVFGATEHFSRTTGKVALVRAELKSRVSEISELELSEAQVTVFFPTDYLSGAEGSEKGDIVVFVEGLFIKPKRTPRVCERLAETVCATMRTHFPDAGLVECFVHSFDPAQGFASK